jgi:O-succinylbenzoate synthase
VYSEMIQKIESIEMFLVRLPLMSPFETSFSVQTHREALLLRVRQGNFFGWGECVAGSDPYYSYETNRTALHIIRDYLAPLLLMMKDITVEEAMCDFNRIRGHRMAKAAVENSLLDLLSHLQNIPLYKLIGGKRRRIPSGISIGMKEKNDDLLESIQQAVNKKYHRIKIKIKRGKDVDIVKTVRNSFPNIRLMVDANADYTIEDLDLLKKLDTFNLMMIEQPLSCDDIYFHSLIQKELQTPICLDESIQTPDHAMTAAVLQSCKVINIKQGRVGGMMLAKSIACFCRGKQIHIWSGGMLETGIGRAFNLHLQTLPEFDLPGDTSETSRYFNEDIVDKPVVLDSDGMIELPEGAGTGVKVVPERLKKYQTFYEKLE